MPEPSTEDQPAPSRWKQTSMLDEYFRDMAAIFGEPTDQEPTDTSTSEETHQATSGQETESSMPDGGETPTPEVQEQATEPPSPPKPLDVSELLKDPIVQSEVDRRAAALAASRERQLREQYERTQAEKAQQEAAVKWEEAHQRLVRLAGSSDDYNDEVVAARKTLAEMEHVRMLRGQWEKESLPHVHEWARRTYAEPVVQALSAQYEEAYRAIPELANPEIRAQLHHSAYPTANQWLVKLVDTITSQRVARAVEEERHKLSQETEKKVSTEAEAIATERLAEHRSRLPSPDLTPAVTGGTGRTYRTQVELEAAYAAGQLTHLTPRQIRILRSSLPYDDSE